MAFCPSCGEEKREGSKFCHNCGYDFEAAGSSASQGLDSNIQSNQGAESNTQFNQNPSPGVQKENSHNIAKILGYICALFIPLFGVIFGVYLYRCDEEDAKKHGKFIIALSVVIWVLSMIAMRM